MTPSDLVRRMSAAGAPAEAIAIALEAIEAVADDLAQRKSKRAEQKRIERARERECRATVAPLSRDVEATLSDTPPKTKVSPEPPSKTQPPTKETPLTGGQRKVSPFDRFWSAYPSKVGKRAAEQAFDRALKRINAPDPLAVMLAGLERSKASKRWEDLAFVPNPATWLNQDRWLDGQAAPNEAAPWDDDRWRAALDLHRERGLWKPDWGPPPDQPGCRAPPAILRERQLEQAA